MVRRGKALCAAAVLSLCVTVGHAANSGADFAGERVSLDARYAANWVLDSGDHQGQPFAIVDKRDARIYVFEPQGRVLGASPVLIGLAPGDLSAPDIAQRSPGSLLPAERTTPAGRFNTEPGHNDKGEDIVWVDYEASLAIHRLRPAPAVERRAERLGSLNAADHRISFGCVVVPVEFYERIVAASLGKRRGVVYVLPETRPVREMFGTLELSAAAAP
ncbi:MAG TPA: hypothetical protein VJN68_16840 [Burkholderiaceae bacterium]|nr:hypothetical protein [Burkholderiaceae bacterium]